ncbi:hypothetical protein ACFVUY_18255 [Kitasatospora sp. NPDC058063]|uniref:hypothetical protein n=1 Tax=unclassified Kitasatospora TaxID=2633591 RepID=UPI0036D968B3
MATPRTLLAAALLACGAATALTGCTPADSGSTVAEASAAALADEGPDDLLEEDDLFYEEDEEFYSAADDPSVPAATAEASVSAAASASASASVEPSVEPFAGPPAEPSAGPGCAAPTARPGHEIFLVVAAGPAELTARPARFNCGSARYEPAGSPVHYGFAGAGVAATLVDGPHDDPARTVPLDELIAHIDDCLAEREPADPYGCHGNAYDVVLDSHGRIMRIGEVDGP